MFLKEDLLFSLKMVELGKWEKHLATLLIGADSLWGGDYHAESGAAHFIAEPWTRP